MEQGHKKTIMVRKHEALVRCYFTSCGVLVNSCIRVYQKKDNPETGFAQKHQKHLVWMASVSPSILHVARELQDFSRDKGHPVIFKFPIWKQIEGAGALSRIGVV